MPKLDRLGRCLVLLELKQQFVVAVQRPFALQIARNVLAGDLASIRILGRGTPLDLDVIDRGGADRPVELSLRDTTAIVHASRCLIADAHLTGVELSK